MLSMLPSSLSHAPPGRGRLARVMLVEELSGDNRGRRRVVPPQIACRPSPCAVAGGVIGEASIDKKEDGSGFIHHLM